MPEQDEETVTVSRAEWEALQQDRLLHNAEQEVVRRVKQHFAWVAVIVAGIGIIGIQALGHYLISTQLSPQIEAARTAAANANAEAKLASDVIAEMREAAQQARKDAQDALSKAEDQSGRADQLIASIDARIVEVDQELSSIEANAENVRTQLRASFESLDSRLTQLAEGAPAPVAMEQRALRAESLTALDRIQENSNYLVQVRVLGNTPVPATKGLVEAFREKGFRTAVADFPGKAFPYIDSKTKAIEMMEALDAPTRPGRVHIAYRSDARQKADEIATVIANYQGGSIDAVLDPTPSAINGQDITVTFGSDAYWQQLAESR